jgi:hypothetical protein
VSQPTPVLGWAELLLALPEFILTDAYIDEHDELVAVAEPRRGLQPCTRCGVIDHHLVHDRRAHRSAGRSPASQSSLRPQRRASKARKLTPRARLTDRGFRNTDNYAARIRLHAGQPRRVPTTTRIRSYTLTTAA